MFTSIGKMNKLHQNDKLLLNVNQIKPHSNRIDTII
jgi:hypothetical protein